MKSTAERRCQFRGIHFMRYVPLWPPMETTHSPEGRQQAARKEREAYNKAVEQAEAVLESEPIPPGHRQTIRRYFELIRPQNEDGSDKALKDGAAKGDN